MCKRDRLAYVFMVVGTILGFFLGGFAGILCAVVSAVAGIVLILAFPIARRSVPTAAPAKAEEQPKIRLEVKEVHACPQSQTGNIENRSPADAHADFDVFIKLSLANEKQAPFHVRDWRMKVGSPEGPPGQAERITGDLDKWQVAFEKESWDLWDTALTTARERLLELNLAEPVGNGTPREGWLHFLVRGITASELQTRPMEIALEDSFSRIYLVVANCPRYTGTVVPVSE